MTNYNYSYFCLLESQKNTRRFFAKCNIKVNHAIGTCFILVWNFIPETQKFSIKVLQIYICTHSIYIRRLPIKISSPKIFKKFFCACSQVFVISAAIDDCIVISPTIRLLPVNPSSKKLCPSNKVEYSFELNTIIPGIRVLNLQI